MVSGKYTALSGALSREQAMANIANNLANVNNTGFKKNRVSFEALFKSAQQTNEAKGHNPTRVKEIITDFSPGGILQTSRSLDLAISGEGFFKVGQGEKVFYTRDGNFFTDQDGMVKNGQGFNVLDDGDQPIQISGIEGKKVHIDQSGNITLDDIASGARIQVFTVNNMNELKKVGDGLFELGEGETSQIAEDSQVLQYSLETSNVNMVAEMVLMINTQRRFEAQLKAQQSFSKLSEKQSELGTIG
jgi:flagellar basal-body rod protein FlgF/flagellar basal-body rod protein FlgG